MRITTGVAKSVVTALFSGDMLSVLYGSAPVQMARQRKNTVFYCFYQSGIMSSPVRRLVRSGISPVSWGRSGFAFPAYAADMPPTSR